MKILIGRTSHSDLVNTGEKAGFWVEEFATPYYVLADAGSELTKVSSKITCQNPASSEAAERVLQVIAEPLLRLKKSL